MRDLEPSTLRARGFKPSLETEDAPLRARAVAPPREHAGAPLVERAQMQQEIATLRAALMRETQRAQKAEKSAADRLDAVMLLAAGFMVAGIAACLYAREALACVARGL